MILIIFKRFTSGSIKGLCFKDHLTVKTKSDLDFIDLIGKNLDAIGPNYIIDNVYIYDKDTDNYLSRKQAELKLEES